MPRTVNVNYVTKEVKILLHDSETESLAAATAIAAAASAQEAKDVVVDNLQDSLDAIDEKTEAEKTELDGYTEERKAEVSTLGQGYVDSASQKVSEANTILSAIRNEYGYPFTAATAADMTDTSKIYVYVGNETGYVNGNWYYHNGTAWVSGGVYNSTAFDTDKTLTVENSPADAKVTGDAIKSTKAEMSLFGVDDLLWDNTNPQSRTNNVVTYTVDKINKTVTLTGTASGHSYLYFYLSNSVFPAWLEKGKPYYIHIYNEKNIDFAVREYVAGGSSTEIQKGTNGTYEFTFSPDAIGASIYLHVPNGVATNCVVRPFISENLGLGELAKTSVQSTGIIVNSSNYTDLLTDVNNQPNNTFYHYSSNLTADKVANLPVYGTVVSITTECLNPSLNYAKRQIAVDANGNLYSRFASYSSGSTKWSLWRSGVVAIILESTDDVDDITEQGRYMYLSNAVTAPANLPIPPNRTTPAYGVLNVYKSSGDPLVIQTYNDYYSNYFTRRGSNGVWSEWKHFVNTDLEMGKREDDCCLSAFRSIGVIGDSLSVGYIQDPNTHTVYRRNLYYSWPQYMARKTGQHIINMGQSGFNVLTWMASAEYGWGVLSNSDNYCQAYIIGLGVNDALPLTPSDTVHHVDLGTIADVNVADYTQNAQTYYGGYAAIIQRARTIRPDSIFLCLLNPLPTTEGESYNQAIIDIVELLNDDKVFVVDMVKYADYFKTSYVVGLDKAAISSHYSPVGYSAIVPIIQRACSDTIKANISAFVTLNLIDDAFGD